MKALTVAFEFSFLDEKIGKRLVVESLRSAINSLVQLEYEKGNPRNSFINAGAIYACKPFGKPKTRFSGFYMNDLWESND